MMHAKTMTDIVKPIASILADAVGPVYPELSEIYVKKSV